MPTPQRVPIPSPALLKDIGDVVRWWKSHGRGKVGASAASDDPRRDMYFAPEVHVALTPPEGIPGMGSGTGTGTGTGGAVGATTGTGDDVDILNSAECALYKVSNAGELVEIGHDQTVYNLSVNDVPGDTYVVVARLKERVWLALTPAGGIPGEAEDSFVALLDGKVATRRDCHYYGWREQTPGKEGCDYAPAVPGRHGTVGAWIKVTVLSAGDGANPALQTVCVMDSEDCTAASTFDVTVDIASCLLGHCTDTVKGDLSDFKTLIEALADVTVDCTGDCCQVLWNDTAPHDPLEIDATNLCPGPCNPMVDWRNLLIPGTDLASADNPPRVRAYPRYVAEPSTSLDKTQAGAEGGSGTSVDPNLISTWRLCITDYCGGTFTLTFGNPGETGTGTGGGAGSDTPAVMVHVDGTVSADDIKAALESVIGSWAVTADGDDCFLIEYQDNGDFDLTLNDADLCDCDNYGMGWFLGGGSGDTAAGTSCCDQDVVVDVSFTTSCEVDGLHITPTLTLKTLHYAGCAGQACTSDPPGT